MVSALETLTTLADYSGASTGAIRHHYDVGNAFYRLWLDESLTYSCALWDDADTLEAAQRAKIDWHVKCASASGAERVLDVGCGWGSTLARLVDFHGVKRAIGLTLSSEQLAHVECHAVPGMEARLENWTDHRPTDLYDAIISIGAFEHFARPDVPPDGKIAGYRRFFERCHAWLRPSGSLSLQTISYENSSRADFSGFFAEHIFPESDLPRLSEIAAASDRLFEVVLLRNDRYHYERTMVEWRRRLRARRSEAVAMVGEEIVDRYNRYLQLATIGFHLGTMGLVRVCLRKLDRAE